MNPGSPLDLGTVPSHVNLDVPPPCDLDAPPPDDPIVLPVPAKPVKPVARGLDKMRIDADAFARATGFVCVKSTGVLKKMLFHRRLPSGRWSNREYTTEEMTQVAFQSPGSSRYFPIEGKNGRSLDVLFRLPVVTAEDRTPEDSFVSLIDGQLTCNTYIAPTIQAKEGDFPFIRSVLANLTCGAPDGIAFLEQFCRWLVVNPGVPCPAAVILLGQKGTGKNVFAAICKELAGEFNSTMLQGPSAMEGAFNPYLDTFLLVGDEVLVKTKEIASTLKTWCTSDYLTINDKNKKLRTIRNRLALLFLSNNPNCIELENGDRRYSVFAQWDKPSLDYTEKSKSMFFNRNPTPGLVSEIAAFRYYLERLPAVNIGTPLENAARRALQDEACSVPSLFADLLYEVNGFEEAFKQFNISDPFSGLPEEYVSADALYACFNAFLVSEWPGSRTVSKSRLARSINERYPSSMTSQRGDFWDCSSVKKITIYQWRKRVP